MNRTAFLLLGMISLCMAAQDPARFEDEVLGIEQRYDTIWDSSTETVVFTGSSSIRLWEDLEELFPDHQIINTGFGGSQASDLLVYSDKLILKYQPKKIFIYEGDNDIFERKSPNSVIRTTKKIIQKIKQNNKHSSIVLISAKPSLVRWHLKRKYKILNRKLKKLAENDTLVEYANVWDTMLEGKELKKSLFIEDGLHMNTKGYDLWYEVIREHLK
ncbi:MAG: G-D-S-L family lipolytic protein [Eudoraea sp.]|nr:G-D-S-L family lipolytic protein [Eudoraea sp.]